MTTVRPATGSDAPRLARMRFDFRSALKPAAEEREGELAGHPWQQLVDRVHPADRLLRTMIREEQELSAVARPGVQGAGDQRLDGYFRPA